jgi:hypothetical protein
MERVSADKAPPPGSRRPRARPACDCAGVVGSTAPDDPPDLLRCRLVYVDGDGTPGQERVKVEAAEVVVPADWPRRRPPSHR